MTYLPFRSVHRFILQFSSCSTGHTAIGDDFFGNILHTRHVIFLRRTIEFFHKDSTRASSLQLETRGRGRDMVETNRSPGRDGFISRW